MYDVSSEFLDKIKEPSRTIKGSVGIGNIELENLVTNGSFIGTTDWTPTTVASFTATDNEASFVANAQYGKIRSNAQTLTVGHKYYVRAILKGTSTSVGLTVGLNATPYTVQSNTDMTTIGEYEIVSTVFTSSETLGNYYIEVIDYRTSAWTTINVKEVIFIDLSLKYGIGNEPSKVYMEGLVEKVGWFDGLTNAPLQFSDDRNINNVAINGNFINTNNWAGLGCTMSIDTPNIMTLTSTGAYSYQFLRQTNSNGAIGDKLYGRLKMTAHDSLVDRFALYINNGYSYDMMETLYTPINGTQYTLSGIITVTTYVLGYLKAIAYYDSGIDNTGSTVDMEEYTIINLTTTYGKGNEPSVEYMDNLIEQTGWFDSIKLTVDETGESTNLIDYTMESSFGSNNIPTIGGVVSNKLSLNILDDSRIPEVLINTPIRPYVSIDIDGLGNYEWVRLGEFYAEYSDVVKSKLTIKIDSFDIMTRYDEYRYDTSLAFPATIQDMINEINTTYNITFASQTLPSMSFPFAPTGTVRQIIGMIASLITTNATINSLGEVEFRFKNDSGFTMNADNYIDFKLTSDSIINISEIIIPTEEIEVSIVSGNTSGFALAFENDAILDSETLDVVYAREFPYSFYAYNMSAQGMPHLEVGDTIEFTDVENVIRTLHIVNHSFSFNGGMSSTFKVDAPKQPTTETTVTGGSTIEKAIARSYESLVIAVQNATGLITGNQGGTIITILDDNGRPTELVICDTGDINTATNVWRWNLSGLGFSSTGYNGNYTTALTIDGHFNADFIDTGTLTANVIKTGVLESADGTSSMDMTNGKFNFGNGTLVFDGTTFSINYEGSNLDTALGEKASAVELENLTTYVRIGGNGITLGEIGNPFQISINNTSMQFIDTGSISQADIFSISGDGTTVTAFFGVQAYTPFPVGSTILVESVPTSAYNGEWVVTEGTNSYCSWLDVNTPIDSGGTIKGLFVKGVNTVAYINQKTMYIENLQATESLIVGVHKIEKYNSDITLIKWIG